MLCTKTTAWKLADYEPYYSPDMKSNVHAQYGSVVQNMKTAAHVVGLNSCSQ